jgi:alkylhydroperoxidase/carboxymuconolactone decarboxylase family protein YurZ
MAEELPKRFVAFRQAYPGAFSAYETFGKECASAGPLAGKTAELVKLGIAIGARMEGATHAHCRRALGAGATAAEVRHTALLAATTIGFPNMMAALAWVDDVVGE